MKCDFCGNETERGKVFDCRSFMVETRKTLNVHIANGWLACVKCAQLIDMDNTHGLIERAISEHMHDIPLTALTRTIEVISFTFHEFMAKKQGEGHWTTHV